MTLILTYASERFVLQISDRLVTRSDRTPFDELANKNIVYCARNAIVAIGYTGHAFLGGIPTDQWIVEKLTGLVFDRDQKPSAFSSIRVNPWLDIGQSLLRLKEALDRAAWSDVQPAFRKDWTDKSFDVCVDGWQWNRRGRYRPLIAWLSKSGASNTFELGYRARTWYSGHKFTIGAAPSVNVSHSQLQDLVNQLPRQSPDETEILLVNTIRQVSSYVPEVGPHCMSILLLAPSISQVHIRYVPVTPAKAIFSTKSSQDILSVAFSPWLIGPTCQAAPSVISGSGWRVALNAHYAAYIDAPDNPNKPDILSSQQRPRFP